MAVTRPSRYPQVAATPGGNFAEPGSGVQLGGWPTGALYPSSDANWLWRQITDWNRSHDASRLASTDILTTKVCRVSSAFLDFDTGTGLNGVITSGGVYYGNGERLDLTDAPTVYAGGSALTFPALSTSYVIARPQPATGGASNGSSCAELAVSAVTPVAGWSTIAAVTTDATDVTSAVETGVTPYLEWSATPNFTAGVYGAFAEFTGSLTSADVTTEWMSADYIALAGTTGQPTIVAQGTTGQAAVLAYGMGTGDALYVYSNGGSGTIARVDAASFGATGVALDVDGNSSSTAATIDAGAGRLALVVTGSSSSSYAATFTNGTTYGISATGSTNGGGGFFSGAGGGLGIYARGGDTAGANGAQVLAQNSTGYGLVAQSHTTATTATAGAYIEGKDSAAGAELVSAGFYPVVLSPDLTSPAYGTLFSRTQGAYPTNKTAGAISFANYALGTRPHWLIADADDAAWRGVWSSQGGFVYGGSYGQTATNADAANYTTLCAVTLTNGNAPKEAGRTLRCEVKIRVRTSTAAANGIDVRVRDLTAGGGAGANVVEYVNSGTGNFAGWPLTGATTGWDRDVTFDYNYTVPAEGARTIALQFKRQTVANTVTAHGSLVVTGAY